MNCLGLDPLAGSLRVTIPLSKSKSIGLSLLASIVLKPVSFNSCKNAEYFGVKEGKGLLVREVGEDEPAAKAGLKVGDVLVKADGKELAMTSDLTRILQEKEKGDKIKLEFYRDKKKRSVEVEVAEEEKDTILRFSPGEWEDYTQTWGEHSDNILRQQNKWQDETSEEMKKQMERMNKEFEEVLKKSKESQEKLLKSLKLHKSIRV